MKKDKVFVQIASYRDPQLVPTLRDMFENAKYPERLHVGICWQHCEKETLEEFANHPQVRYQDFHYTVSEGLGWARSKVSELYDDEEYTLQFDSHHRFAPNWDEMMYEDYEQAKQMSDKPIISTYLTPFEATYKSKDELNPIPCLMKQYEFSPDKLIMSMPHYIGDYKQRDKVIRTRTISGHFYFVHSDFMKEVPYDPEIYFGGYCEETTMSIRAWTRGYDFFSPYRQYIWHEYTRQGRPKHWDDHGSDSKTEKTSTERDAFGRSKTRQIFRIEDNGIDIEPIYDLGDVRTLDEWIEFSGVNTKTLKISKYTLEGKEPPNPTEEEDEVIVKDITVTVTWDVDFFKNQYDGVYKTITFGILDDKNVEIYRNDFTKENNPEVLSFEHNQTEVNLEVEDETKLRVVMYGLTPDNQWSERYERMVG